jgi:hypothetical protein
VIADGDVGIESEEDKKKKNCPKEDLETEGVDKSHMFKISTNCTKLEMRNSSKRGSFFSDFARFEKRSAFIHMFEK